VRFQPLKTMRSTQSNLETTKIPHAITRGIPALQSNFRFSWSGLWCKDSLAEFRTIAMPSRKPQTFDPKPKCPYYQHPECSARNPQHSILHPNALITNTLNAVEREHVSITCQANYRLSPRGNPSPECLPTGFWTQHQRDQWSWTADPLR
jgi:hypothetical protein